MAERLQWVAFAGLSRTVFAITFRRVSLGSGGTHDGQVLSRFRPFTPSLRYLSCQRQTVGFDVFSRRMISPHDLEGAVTVRCRQHDLRPPDKLARGVVVGDQGLKLGTVSGAKKKADVIASHTPNMAHQAVDGNPMSGGEH